MVPVPKTTKKHVSESSSDSDSEINSEVDQKISQNISNILKGVILKHTKVPNSGLIIGIERRLTEVFRCHPNPSHKRIKKLSVELDMSEENIDGWFKSQSHTDFLETEKVKGMIFHVLVHAYLQKVSPVAASAFLTSLQV